MIKKLIDSTPRLSHSDLADPQASVPFAERLVRANAVDHLDNVVLEDVGDGFVRFRAVDPAKRHRPS